MKRTKRNRAADAILMADPHLTESTPVSRTDDYMAAQENKLEFIRTLSRKNGGCPVLCSGDVFDHWKASPWLCAWAFEHIPPRFVTIPGNHDLPLHSMEMYHKSALSLIDLVLDSHMTVMDNPAVYQAQGTGRAIVLLHELIFPTGDQSLSRVAQGRTAQEVLEEYGEYDLILTGDNHQTFVEEREGTLLVNPGSMMRITADQVDHKPCVYLYYADKNEVVPVELPIKRSVHSREHIDRREERDERIAAYIERLNQDWDNGLNFRQNLEAFCQENNVPRKVREVVWEHLET